MTEEIAVTKARVKFTGIFDMGDFYRLLYDLFRSMNYDVEEQKYKNKVRPDGDEVELEWNCFKKVDDYVQFKVFCRVAIFGLQKVQVQVEGMQTSRNRGECEVELKCFVQTDYENRWETNPMLKFLKGFYDVYIYKSTLTLWKDRIATEMHTVENEVKAFFNMQRFM
jgi:hypothetical protein